jgi:hypothetical protein
LFFHSIEVNTKPEVLIVFVRNVMDRICRNPWEDETGELDWDAFSRKLSLTRKDVIEQWITFSDSPDLSFSFLEIQNDPPCPKCGRNIDDTWIICPFCGEPANSFQNDLLIRK